MNELNHINQIEIENRIFTVRGVQVMTDRDLAEMYGVETKVLNQAVKRNINRFPDQYRFQLTVEETTKLVEDNHLPGFPGTDSRSQFVTLNNKRGKNIKYLPYVFTEQGVSMLSAVLRSETAIKVSIKIINTFVEMRKFISANAGIFQRLDKIEHKQIETDHKFEKVFKALEEKSVKPKQGIFYNGQIFDAYTFTADIIREAGKSIILIDNFIDDSVLTLLSKRSKNVTATIYTREITKQLRLDLAKHNKQYPEIRVNVFKNAHDRFLIIDKSELYHFGASLKDLGRKWFAFSKMNFLLADVLQKLI